MKKIFVIIFIAIITMFLSGCGSSSDVSGRWYFDDQMNIFLKEDKTCELMDHGNKEGGLCTWEYSSNHLTLQLDSQIITGTHYPSEGRLLISGVNFYRDLNVAKEKNKTETVNAETKVIPNMENMTLLEAEQTLKNEGFTVASTVEEIGSDNIEKGYVVKTSPAMGRSVKKGTEITIYVSKGPEKYTIEDYTGKNYIETKTILENNHGLNVVIEKKEVEDESKYDENLIIDQDVKPGTVVSKGANITLYIPDVVVRYPDFTDGTWTKEDIENLCKKYGVDLEIKYESKQGYKSGDIISQSRPKDMPIVKGVTLEIHVAK